MLEKVIIGIMANILRTYTIYRFMELLYHPKNTKVNKKTIYIVFIILTSGMYYIFQNFVITLATNIFGLFLIVTKYKGSLAKNGFLILGIYSVNVLVESLVFTVIGWEQSSLHIMESINECIVSIGILIIVLVIEKTKAIKENIFNVKLTTWIGLICVPIVSIFIILLLLDRRITRGNYIELEILGILIINIAIFFLYGSIQDYYKQKIEREIFEFKMNVYSNELDVLKDSYQKMRELKHDIKHHILELKFLVYNGNQQQALKYIDMMEQDIVNTAGYVDSGNKDIDSTLNFLLQSAKKYLKKVNIKVVVPENLNINQYRFNIILANLLENAITAAKESEEQFLDVNIKTEKNILYVEIQNSFAGEIIIKNGWLETTKTEKENHGLGLKSVYRIIHEINGDIKLECTDKFFSAKAMLYIDILG